jgi:hypothetical protein
MATYNPFQNNAAMSNMANQQNRAFGYDQLGYDRFNARDLLNQIDVKHLDMETVKELMERTRAEYERRTLDTPVSTGPTRRMLNEDSVLNQKWEEYVAALEQYQVVKKLQGVK